MLFPTRCKGSPTARVVQSVQCIVRKPDMPDHVRRPAALFGSHAFFIGGRETRKEHGTETLRPWLGLAEPR